jgi:PPOX class probable F420-dependent enzyme
MIDFNSTLGQRALERLNSEEVIWLISTDEHGYPQPNPVWFVLQDQALLIYSMPNAKRLKYIAARPQVAAHFDSTGHGDDIIVFTGRAQIDPSQPPADTVSAYIEKYREGIKRIDSDPASFAKSYTVGYRVELLTLRGF